MQNVNVYDVAQKCGVKSEVVKSVCEKLEKLNIGKLNKVKNNRGQPSFFFNKRNDALVKEDLLFVNAIESLGFNINKYCEINVDATR